MTIRYYAPILLFFLITKAVFAQRQNVYFLKNNGKQVGNKDSADLIRVIKEPDSGSVAYNLIEYYPNGKLKRVSKTLTIDKITLDGTCVTYFKSGKRQTIANYSNGYLTGDMFTYFPNGVLYTVKSFDKQASDFVIKTSNDTSGKPMVVEGNGRLMTYTADLKQVSTEGDLKNGLKNGEWKAYKVTHDSLNVVEIYADGKLVRGKSTDKAGKTYTYEARDETPPSFEGGTQGFSTFLTEQMRYPAEAKKNNIQGRVFVSFVVQADGSLTDIKVTRSPDATLSAEAIRVIKLSPKWIPGLQYGRPVRVQYTVPINFTLR